MEIIVDYMGDIVCMECGNMLEFEWNNNRQRIEVEGCPDCLSDKGREEYDKGYEEGNNAGYDEGYDAAQAEKHDE